MPAALQARLGDAAAGGLVELFDLARQEWTVEVTTATIERFDRLSGGLSDLRVEVTRGDAASRLELAATRQELRDGDAGVRLEISNLRFDLLKWCFAFWIGQVVAIVGILGLLFRLPVS